MAKVNSMTTLSNSSQLLLRSLEHFESGHWALINPTDSAIFNHIDNANIVGLHQYHHIFSECQQKTQRSQYFAAGFTLADLQSQALDGVVIYMPKSKQQLAMLIDNAASLVKKGAVVLIVGENKAGIKSVPKLLEKIGKQVNKVDSAKHCGLYAVTVNEPLEKFDVDDYAIIRTYQINQQPIQVFSLPGVFGHKQLDPGTDLLLQQLSPKALAKTKGHIYDFACGTGVIGCYLAKVIVNDNCEFSMSDVSALATYSSKKTAELNKVKVNVIACDGLAQLARKFDAIVSNPPFHAGMQNDYSITEAFIKEAYSRSNLYASMTLVANKFLPYPDILDAVYKGFTEVAASNKFRVYGATKFTK